VEDDLRDKFGKCQRMLAQRKSKRDDAGRSSSAGKLAKGFIKSEHGIPGKRKVGKARRSDEKQKRNETRGENQLHLNRSD